MCCSAGCASKGLLKHHSASVNTIIPLAAAEHGASDVNIRLTALLYDRKVLLLSEELLQVRQRESIFLVVLLVKTQRNATIETQQHLFSY